MGHHLQYSLWQPGPEPPISHTGCHVFTMSSYVLTPKCTLKGELKSLTTHTAVLYLQTAHSYVQSSNQDLNH